MPKITRNLFCLLMFSSCKAPAPPAPPAPAPRLAPAPAEAAPASAPASCGAQSEAASAPWGRQWHAIWEDGARAWVVGGYAASASERCLHPAALLSLDGEGAREVPGLARWGHSVTALEGERALVVGGSALDPERSPWEAPPTLLLGPGEASEVIAGPARASAFHEATRLEDGRVLLTGGAASHEETLARAALFDPMARAWVEAAPMRERRQGHAAARLPGGDVLVVGGVRAGRDGVSARDCAADEDCAGGTWCHDAWFCVSAAPGAERWGAASGQWRDAAAPEGLAATARVVALPGGDALVIGGRGAGAASASVWRYEAARGRWVAAAPLAQAREGHSATLAPDGRVWVVGGRARQGDAWEELASVEIYDPARGRWVEGPALQVARRGHEARWRGAALWVVGGVAGGERVSLIERVGQQ
jgi:hypothetical protein